MYNYLHRTKCNGPSGSLYIYNKVRYWLLKHRIGLYNNCTTLKLLVYIIYNAWSVMVQLASLYTYNKVRYWLLKPRSGLYINCTILKLLVYIIYNAWSVMVQLASLYTYNKVRYWLLKPRSGLYINCTTLKLVVYNYLHRTKCNSPIGKFVHLQQG